MLGAQIQAILQSVCIRYVTSLPYPLQDDITNKVELSPVDRSLAPGDTGQFEAEGI